VIEQNRDGQMRMLLINECEIDPARLLPILSFDSMPITADFIVKEIRRLIRLSEHAQAGKAQTEAAEQVLTREQETVA
jgi:2-oxoglutarate ferredoxin oxidoreductase subunit alpha